MEKYEEVKKTSKKVIIINNFLGGISWAIGVSIGFSLLVAILGYIAVHVNLIPFIGSFISDIIDFILKNNQSLHR